MTEQASIKTFPNIQGHCPSCRGSSLFVGGGGYITCSRIDCPDPSAADDVLHGSMQEQLDKARGNAQQLGADVVTWAALARDHQHWGHRRWNAWKSARRRAQRQRELLAEVEALRDDLRGVTGARWIADSLDSILNGTASASRADAVIARVREVVAILTADASTARLGGYEQAAYALDGAVLRINSAIDNGAAESQPSTDSELRAQLAAVVTTLGKSEAELVALRRRTEGAEAALGRVREAAAQIAGSVERAQQHGFIYEGGTALLELTQALYGSAPGAATEATQPPLLLPPDMATTLHRTLGQLLGDQDAQAIARLRALHREEYGSCAECTHAISVLWPCPTIRALDGEEPQR
ncbi:hypothetical protein [Streptomyces sp. 1222.5]|uniref:hypothetical protein n=1 Tax=Streptomyces sp. 1222.5 TaxID=1881026 RepID=UPI003EBC70AE